MVLDSKLMEGLVKEYNRFPSKTDGCIMYVLLKDGSAPPNHCVKFIMRVVIQIWFSFDNDNI
jgi:hypothetical protein